MIPKVRLGSRRSTRAFSNWVGPSGKTCGLTAAGQPATSNVFTDMQRNWSRSRQMLSWPLAARQQNRCCGRPAPYPSCSWLPPTGLAPASSIVWRGRAATPPDLFNFEYGISGKWLELLKQIAPGVTRAAVLRDPAISAGIGQFGAIQAVAPSL